MRRLFSILSALLILLSGMQLTVSLHFCGGEIAESRVSLLGSIASCGMEGVTDECTQPGGHLESHCCDNRVSVYVVDHNFNPSFSEFKVLSQMALQVFDIPQSLAIDPLAALKRNSISHSPPDLMAVNAVSLPKICVFRI